MQTPSLGGSHFVVQAPDTFHQVGQVLLRPITYLMGREYQIAQGVHELPTSSTLGKVVVAALAILLAPITILAAMLGIMVLSCSRTYLKAYNQVCESIVSIKWEGNRPEIATRQLKIRPIRADDLPVYQALFNNRVAMQNFRGGVRDITHRFNIWLNRWQEHSFSALAVTLDNQVIGHTIIGHGDFEGHNQGFSEMAVVIDPAYWSDRYGDGIRGTEGRHKIGSEVVRAMVAYARALKERGALVPVDVNPGQDIVNANVHRNAAGVVDWAYVPFTEVRATVHRHNLAALTIGETLSQEFGAAHLIQDVDRDLFTLQLA